MEPEREENATLALFQFRSRLHIFVQVKLEKVNIFPKKGKYIFAASGFIDHR